MEEPDIDTNIAEHLTERKGLRLVHSEKRESLLPDPKLKDLIEKMKGKPKRVRMTFNDGSDAA